MNEYKVFSIDAISIGRSPEDVLDVYMRIWGDAKKVSEKNQNDPDQILADIMAVTAYRIYLLGVEDGMKGASKNGRTN